MRHRFVVACLSLIALPFAAAADPVYDGFDYPAGSSLAGQNGGSGWGGAWSNAQTALDATIGPGLAFGTLSTAPGSVTSAAPSTGNVAFFSRPLGAPEGADGTTLFLSVLLRPEAGFGFYGGINLGGLFIGKSGPTTTYGIEGPTNDIASSAVVAVAGQTVLLVLRADFLPGDDRFSLFVDPTPGAAEPAVADAVKTDLDQPTADFIFLNNAGGWTTDEIRTGATFAAVTPVPEPAALGLLAVALALLTPCTRRNQVPAAGA